MRLFSWVPLHRDPIKRNFFTWGRLPTLAFFCAILLLGRTIVHLSSDDEAEHFMKKVFILGVTSSSQTAEFTTCKNQSKPSECVSLPSGIIRSTTNLELQHLWKSPYPRKGKVNIEPLKTLLAMAVGIKQKEVVNQIVKKFSSTIDSTVMLFHYDGFSSEWRDLEWIDKALHVSVANQTKWWFAKRFLHPDIVAEYDYIFLWDEDIEVHHFNPKFYLSIVRREGLQISQPGLDFGQSEVHHRITVRSRKGDVHRRIYASTRSLKCDENSTGPPCTGWVEMMVPVFSKAAWRCTWHLIQNDLVFAWGLDYKLGYCAQGDRTQNVGIIDSEYIVHKGIPSLGGSDMNKTNFGIPLDNSLSNASTLKTKASGLPCYDSRTQVRLRSYAELRLFEERWRKAASADACWRDPYP
ncbi:hypothetical protein HPP92_013162 [Vanilla planifolia]|uniref:Uncharacterized protein n=1 Tax=Vanilla planifolia TaxID=51239 RepID=A0A835R1W2_VANPL|nr:hypothetical protein HPP92_013162 [Vanilla planifolia]